MMKVTIHNIARHNPKVKRDRKVLEDALALVASLRKMGIRPKGYTLRPRFGSGRTPRRDSVPVVREMTE